MEEYYLDPQVKAEYEKKLQERKAKQDLSLKDLDSVAGGTPGQKSVAPGVNMDNPEIQEEILYNATYYKQSGKNLTDTVLEIVWQFMYVESDITFDNVYKFLAPKWKTL